MHIVVTSPREKKNGTIALAYKFTGGGVYECLNISRNKNRGGFSVNQRCHILDDDGVVRSMNNVSTSCFGNFRTFRQAMARAKGLIAKRGCGTSREWEPFRKARIAGKSTSFKDAWEATSAPSKGDPRVARLLKSSKKAKPHLRLGQVVIIYEELHAISGPVEKVLPATEREIRRTLGSADCFLGRPFPRAFFKYKVQGRFYTGNHVHPV